MTRDGFTDIASSVSFKTLDTQGSATAGTDYLSQNGILGFSIGEISKEIEIQDETSLKLDNTLP